MTDHFYYFSSALTVNVTLERMKQARKSGFQKTVDIKILRDFKDSKEVQRLHEVSLDFERFQKFEIA